jgi:membrane associated rhomboid family serine protease
MQNLTPIVKNILLLNVLIFIVQSLLPGLNIAEHLALYNVHSPYYKPYQLFTYMFVHAGFFHILMNMLGLVFLGPILETYWGQNKFVLFYIITGIGAGVFNILIDHFFGIGTFGSMVGASGAIYGILTAFGVQFPNMEVRLLFPPITIKAKYIVMILGSLAIYSGFTNSPGDNTANFAHLGGILVALIILQVWKYRN